MVQDIVAPKIEESKYTLIPLFLVYFVPITLLWAGVIDYEYRFTLLMTIAGAGVLYALWSGMSKIELGIRTDNFKASLAWNLGFVALIGGLILLLYAFNMIREATVPDWKWFFFFYIFISSPAQEWVYRSIVFAKLRRTGIRNSTALVLISAANYSYMHVFYHDVITLVTTFGIGIVWGIIYFKIPNWYSVSISHAVLGAISIAVGLI